MGWRRRRIVANPLQKSEEIPRSKQNRFSNKIKNSPLVQAFLYGDESFPSNNRIRCVPCSVQFYVPPDGTKIEKVVPRSPFHLTLTPIFPLTLLSVSYSIWCLAATQYYHQVYCQNPTLTDHITLLFNTSEVQAALQHTANNHLLSQSLLSGLNLLSNTRYCPEWR